jgi:hypothetical protein
VQRYDHVDHSRLPHQALEEAWDWFRAAFGGEPGGY